MWKIKHSAKQLFLTTTLFIGLFNRIGLNSVQLYMKQSFRICNLPDFSPKASKNILLSPKPHLFS